MAPPLDRFEWERLIREIELPPAQKLTAYALATYVNGDGSNAHPGIAKLARATGQHRATVIRALDSLEAAGYIRVRMQGGAKGVRRGLASVYELSVPVENPGRHRIAGETS